MKFCARQAILGARLCMWEIVYVKEQTCTSLIIKWYGSRSCTKLMLKIRRLQWPLYFSLVYCSFPVDYTISVCMMTTPYLRIIHDLFTEQRYNFWQTETRSSIANLTYWRWTTNLVMKIPVQLLLTHCQLPWSIWRLWSIWILHWDRPIKRPLNLR